MPDINKSIALAILVLFIILTGCNPQSSFFKIASPVWAEGRELEKNMTLVFSAEFDVENNEAAVKLRITGSGIYRIHLNGKFVGHGPARAAHGYYRVDEWELGPFVRKGDNQIAIEAVGYNANSFYLLDQPSFLQAEIVQNNKMLKATGLDGDFHVFENLSRVKEVPRYSFQRPFVEVYKMKGQDITESAVIEVAEQESKRLLPRNVPYPDFKVVRPVAIIAEGSVSTGHKREHYWKDRAVKNIGPKLKGFKEDELVINPSISLQEMEFTNADSNSASLESNITSGFQTWDFGLNNSGFIGLGLNTHKPVTVYLVFDEILQNNEVNWMRLGTMAAVTYMLDPGDHQLETIEPYTFRYLKIIVPEGGVEIKDLYLREFSNPEVNRAFFESSDARLNRIYQAGVETYRQNAVDIFMDCPHRERAGWLCDSYFTARVAQDLSGNQSVEKNFLENFLLPDTFEHLPEGMLPMCYPADHYDSVFIPNWAMWYVVELGEYLTRSQDRSLIDLAEERVIALIEYFKPFKNEDGLLENLDSWIFVEWSAANSFVQDVNYPTNMLYSKMLEMAGNLYEQPGWVKEAEAVREVIRKQSYNGEFFRDHAKRPESAISNRPPLAVADDVTEVCQYYAFYFGIATPESYPELWNKLEVHFGPSRAESNLFPEVHLANSFIGNYLRIELLSRYGLQKQLMDESIDFFDYMARQTGTLWENTGTYASCNHGFASHIVHVLYRDVLGIASIDTQMKEIIFHFSDLNLEKCHGEIPLGNDRVSLSWTKGSDQFTYRYTIPDGYSIKIRNNTNLELVNEVTDD